MQKCNFFSSIFLKFVCRNLSHRVTEADSRQICTRRVSRQQCRRYKCPANHWRAEGQQTPVLPEPVTLCPMTLILSSTFTSTSHHLCTFSPRSSAHGQLPHHFSLFSFLNFFFNLYFCFIKYFWSHSCSSFLPWKKHFRSLYVTQSVCVKVPVTQEQGSLCCLTDACKVVWTETLSSKGRLWDTFQWFTTRWCCVNKLQTVTPTRWSSIVLFDSVALTSFLHHAKKYPHYVFIEEDLAEVIIVLLSV